MKMNEGEIKIFSGNSNLPLTEDICRQMGKKPAACVVTAFSDGECSITIKDTVRGCDVFIVQSTCPPVNDHLMELLIMIDACKRASAGRITAVIPYFGYARQDRKAKARDPISAKLAANLIMCAGANRVLTLDLHAAQIQGFFDIPVDNLMGSMIFAAHCQRVLDVNDEDFTVVSPDIGSVARSRLFADSLDLNLAIVEKRRQKANSCEVMNIIGEVKGKNILMFDDMVDTAGSLCGAAEILKESGAREIYAFATHGVLSGPAVERIEASAVNKLYLLDTIPYPGKKICAKIAYLPVSTLIAEAIDRIHEEISISSLFNAGMA